MGRWSRQLAPMLISWLGIPEAANWLDVGCGTGALSNAILSQAHPASVVGCDPAEAFIDFARAHVQDPRISFVKAGSGDLPRREDGYGSVTSMLALNFFPDPKAAVDEMASLAIRGGTVSACVWDYAGRMDFLRRFWDAAVQLDSEARMLDEGVRFPLCRPDRLTDLFRTSDLSNIRCDPLEITTVFASFDDFWRPLLGTTGPAPSYLASLDTDSHRALETRLDNTLERGTGGTITLTARAWAICGTHD